MIIYIFKRLMLGFISLLALIILVYFLMYFSKRQPINESDYPEMKGPEFEKFKTSLGLNETIWVRFSIYFKGLFYGDFGLIYGESSSKTIPELFFSPLKYTITITSISFGLSVLLGVSLGFIAGYNSGKIIDHIINFIVIMLMAIPAFILAAIFLIIGPMMKLNTSFLDPSTFGILSYLKSIILPVLVLTLGSLSAFTYYTRNEIKSILTSDYITNARSKGMGEWAIFKKYVFRNSLIPIITIVLPGFVILLGGSFIIETFFAVPGTSIVIIDAIKKNETNVVMFNVLFFGAISIIMRIIVDVLYVVIDPRIRYSAAQSSNSLILKKLFKPLRSIWGGKKNVTK